MDENLTPAQLKEEYKRNYYLNNQEKFKKMIKCEVCNCNIQKYTLNRHNKLKKHLFYYECYQFAVDSCRSLWKC